MAVRDSSSGSAGNAVPPAPGPRRRSGRPCRRPAAATPPPPRSPACGSEPRPCAEHRPCRQLLSAAGAAAPRRPAAYREARPPRRGGGGARPEGLPCAPGEGLLCRVVGLASFASAGLALSMRFLGSGSRQREAVPVRRRRRGARCSSRPVGLAAASPAPSPLTDPCELPRPLPAQGERACVRSAAGRCALIEACVSPAPSTPSPVRLHGLRKEAARRALEPFPPSRPTSTRQQGVGSSNDQQCLTGEALAG